MGTRFVASAESANHPGHQERIVSAKGNDVVETILYDVVWPDASHRIASHRIASHRIA
jgi:nitronate monooxygenase